MKKLTLFCLMTTLFLMTSCDTKKAQEEQKDNNDYNTVQLDVPFKMTQRKGVQFENDDLKIIFNSVSEDSRCPLNTTCVWEGQVVLNLTVNTKNGSEKIEMLLKGKQRENVIQEVGMHTIYLMAVNPYQREGEKIEQEDYKITMVVK